mgnify:CR=1 FL=1
MSNTGNAGTYADGYPQTYERRRPVHHSVEPPKGDGQICLEAIRTEDGKNWWAAFTSFEEELKGGGSIKSTFLTDIDKLFELTLQTDEIEGVILNPWNRTIMLDKYLIEIILGKTA